MGDRRYQVFSDEDLLAIIDQHRHPDGRANSTALAAELGVMRSTVQSRLTKLAHQGRLLGEPAAMPGFEITKVVSQTEDGYITQRPEQSEQALDLPEGHILERASLKVGDSWYKTKLSPGAWTRDAVEEMLSEHRGKSEILTSPTDCDAKQKAIYFSTDLHNGVRAWGKDSGRDWDLQIAEREFIGAHGKLIRLTPPTKIAILLDMGDQFHINDQTNATPMHHHRLDADGRFPKVAKVSVDIRRKSIEMALQHHEFVEYVGVPGNHDPEAQMWLSIGMALLFENHPRVKVYDEPGDFWFHEFGRTALLANHGHKIKPDELPGIMAHDYPEAWGRTTYRYCYSGHRHRERSGEKMGVRWESMRTMNPGDNYSHTGGWRSGHELTSITFSAETGQSHRQYVPV